MTITEQTKDDTRAAIMWWSDHIRPTLGIIPVEALGWLWNQYVRDVLANPVALAELRAWWRP